MKRGAFTATTNSMHHTGAKIGMKEHGIRVNIVYFLCFFMLITLLILTGCARMMEAEYMVQTTHSEQSDGEENPGYATVVSSYKGLVDAISSFVSEGQEQGIVRLINYEGDAVEDMSKVGMEIKLESPLGAYAVDYITYESNRILSYYEMSVSISYRRTKEQIDSIISVSTAARLRDEINSTIRSSGKYLAVEISSDNVTESVITEGVTKYYYENPLSLLFLPMVNVNMYPANTSKKIVEIEFEYPYTAYSIDRMRISMYDGATVILGGIIGTDEEKALDICLALIDHVEYRETRDAGADNWSHENTAYGAVTAGVAAAQGYAMAFKLLCDIAEIECDVVIGRLDGLSHAWNIIGINGDYYHIDPSMCDHEGIETAFLKRDEDMWARYWWDSEKYAACNGSMTYWDLVSEEALEDMPTDADEYGPEIVE